MRLLLAVAVLALGSPASAHFDPIRRCTHVSRGFRACTTFYERKDEQSAIYRHTGASWTKVRGGLPHRPGWWRRVVAAHDRKTLLAQWSGECELQSTYFVSSSGGRARPIFRGHASTIAGWTHPGLARVRLEEAVWRKNVQVYRPGVYLVNPKTLAVRLQNERPARPGC
jgi:hypothetical protein